MIKCETTLTRIDCEQKRDPRREQPPDPAPLPASPEDERIPVPPEDLPHERVPPPSRDLPGPFVDDPDDKPPPSRDLLGPLQIQTGN